MRKPPKYRHYKPRNKGFSETNGKRIYFKGKYNSPESKREYAAFLSRWADAQSTRDVKMVSIRMGEVTITRLCISFLDYAKQHYRKHDRSTGTYERYRDYVMPPLLKQFGSLPTADFSPLKLKAVRQHFVDVGLARNTVNDMITRIKTIFSWGVENELVPESVAGALRYVRSLRAGETTARETKRITTVSRDVVERTLKELSPVVADMVSVQLGTGCRPGEVRNMRWADIDVSDDIWLYTPIEHKTEHHDKERCIGISANVQKILSKYKDRSPNSFIFSPIENVKIFNNSKKLKKLKQKTINTKKLASKRSNDKILIGEQYTKNSYNRAIRRACERAGISPAWTPNQLRHSFATDVRDQLGVEASQLLLGHAEISTTEIYAERTRKNIKATIKRFSEINE